MKTFGIALVLAALAAVLIHRWQPPPALDAQLMRLQVKEALPALHSELESEPLVLQALFLSYAHQPILLSKARVALLRYPDIARPILQGFGERPVFQDILQRYGEDVLLPIHYFMHNQVWTVSLMHGLNETTRSAWQWWRGETPEETPGNLGQMARLSPEERAAYAMHFIDIEGYDFIGQFVVNARGEVAWIQTERVLEGMNQFFASGLRGLETKLRQDETVGVADAGWAALDVAIGVSAFKLLRVGKAGALGARSMSFSQRSAALGAGLWRGTTIGARLVKYGAPVVLGYVALRHPSVINALLGSTAEKLGLPVALVQILGWTLLLLPVLLVMRFLIGPLAWLLISVGRSFKWMHQSLMRRPQTWM